jgi:hypothetical protein
MKLPQFYKRGMESATDHSAGGARRGFMKNLPTLLLRRVVRVGRIVA